MPVLDNYLFFNGNCAQAIRFYERTLGGKLEMMMTYGQSPEPEHCPAGSADRIMHARMALDGRALMASDVPQDQPWQGMNGFSLSLIYPAADEARRVFDALADGGNVTMAMQKDLLGRGLRDGDRPLRHALDGRRRDAAALTRAKSARGGCRHAGRANTSSRLFAGIACRSRKARPAR